jgi:HAMP domain-containing protein
MSSHWAFVLAAYAIAAVVLLGYWWRVERRLREAEAAPRGSS